MFPAPPRPVDFCWSGQRHRRQSRAAQEARERTNASRPRDTDRLEDSSVGVGEDMVVVVREIEEKMWWKEERGEQDRSGVQISQRGEKVSSQAITGSADVEWLESRLARSSLCDAVPRTGGAQEMARMAKEMSTRGLWRARKGEGRRCEA